jgi:hypothetical protein
MSETLDGQRGFPELGLFRLSVKYVKEIRSDTGPRVYPKQLRRNASQIPIPPIQDY